MNIKKKLAVIIAVLVLIASCFIPGNDVLTGQGIKTIGITLMFLILLISEALPMIVTCLLCIGLMPVLHATGSFNEALSGFSNQVVFFILASFGIADAFAKVPLTTRTLAFLLKHFGKNIKSILFAMMVCAALLSSIVSNVPTCAIFMALSLGFLEFYEDEDEKKRTGRAFMIAVPVASMIGGMITPAGSSINLLAISLLEKYTDTTITFVQWMGLGIPLTILMLPMAWFLAVKIFKPAEIEQDKAQAFISNLNASVPEKLTGEEIRVLIVTVIMLVLWIASSWIRSINVMVVALLGCVVLLLPRIGVLECNTFFKNVSWDSFFLVGTVLSIGNAMVSSGVSDWITTLLPQQAMSRPVFFGFVALLIFVLLIIIPVAPSLVTLMSMPIITMSAANGCSPALAMLALGLVAANCYLLPLDTVTLLTYGTGYYSMTDMPKCTVWIQLYMVLLMAFVAPPLAALLGF